MTLTADELVCEMQRSIKTLLGLGARLPKELMLFVKNLMFLDGAIATLAPDLDLFAEVEAIPLMFAAKHGERIMAQLGLEARGATGRRTWPVSRRASGSTSRPSASPTASSRPGGPRCARSSKGGLGPDAPGRPGDGRRDRLDRTQSRHQHRHLTGTCTPRYTGTGYVRGPSLAGVPTISPCVPRRA